VTLHDGEFGNVLLDDSPVVTSRRLSSLPTPSPLKASRVLFGSAPKTSSYATVSSAAAESSTSETPDSAIREELLDTVSSVVA
jgi:hypothetical protein